MRLLRLAYILCVAFVVVLTVLAMISSKKVPFDLVMTLMLALMLIAFGDDL